MGARSYSAKSVAEEVIKIVGKGGNPHIQKIAEKHGYSKASARSGKAQETKSYKSVMEPAVKKLENIRNRLIEQLETQDLSKERPKDQVDMIAKLNHDIQLLGGKPTENIQILSQEEQENIDKLLQDNL